jgi:hypothetical protein
VTSDCLLYRSQAFEKLADGTHTLRFALAPRDESDIHTFLDEARQDPIPRFDLTVKYCERDMPSDEFVKFSYSPSSESLSGSCASPADRDVSECQFDREKIDGLYRRGMGQQSGINERVRR